MSWAAFASDIQKKSAAFAADVQQKSDALSDAARARFKRRVWWILVEPNAVKRDDLCNIIGEVFIRANDVLQVSESKGALLFTFFSEAAAKRVFDNRESILRLTLLEPSDVVFNKVDAGCEGDCPWCVSPRCSCVL